MFTLGSTLSTGLREKRHKNYLGSKDLKRVGNLSAVLRRKNRTLPMLFIQIKWCFGFDCVWNEDFRKSNAGSKWYTELLLG
jgi:hypothetical protein